MKVEQVMVPFQALAQLPTNSTVEDAGSCMIAKDVGSVVVIDEVKNQIAGILTMRDVLNHYISGRNARDSIENIMAGEDIVCIDKNETRSAAASLMWERHIHHLIVEDHGSDKIVGLVSCFDLTRDNAGEHPQMKNLQNVDLSSVEPMYLPRHLRYKHESKLESKEGATGSGVGGVMDKIKKTFQGMTTSDKTQDKTCEKKVREEMPHSEEKHLESQRGDRSVEIK